MGISIIIIHYQTDSYTVKCLQSLCKHIDIEQYEILLIDNGSEKPFQVTADLNEEKIKVVRLEKNLGYAGAANKGIDISTFEYFLILNSDVEFIESGLHKCLNQMEKDNEIGALSCRLLYPDKTSQPVANRFSSIKKELIELFRIQKLNKKGTWLLGSYFSQNTSLFCDWIWGTFFLSKKEWLKDLPKGKLDDSFFLYYEDVFWCKQFHDLGKKILYFSEYSIIHHQSKSVGESIGNDSKFQLMSENENSFILQNKGWLYAFVFYLVRSINFASHFSKGNFSLAGNYFKRAFHQI